MKPDRPTPLHIRRHECDSSAFNYATEEDARTLERDRAELMECLDDLLTAAEAHVYARYGIDPGMDDEPDVNKEARALLSRLRGEG